MNLGSRAKLLISKQYKKKIKNACGRVLPSCCLGNAYLCVAHDIKPYQPGLFYLNMLVKSRLPKDGTFCVCVGVCILGIPCDFANGVVRSGAAPGTRNRSVAEES